MSTALFWFGMICWIFFQHPGDGCLMLSLAWLFHNGKPDG